ncbi:MAG: YfiR family protein [Candidatus Thiodiazotropha sp.]
MSIRLILTILVTIACWGHAPPAVAEDPDTNADLLKAVFIYNFAKFTRWPDDANRPNPSALSICILGSDEVSRSLPRLSGRTIQGRTLNVIDAPSEPIDPHQCQILYIANNPACDYRKLFHSLAGLPVLTVSQTAGFTRNGGMVELRQSGDKIRIIINRGETLHAGLTVSARLLNVATVIDTGDEP